MIMQFNQQPERHQAVGHSDDNGKTVIYTCPLCPGWQRTFDLEKGTMKTENKDLYFHISHFGGWSLLPPELMGVSMGSEIVQKSAICKDIELPINKNLN